MAEVKVINLEIKDNAQEVEKHIEDLVDAGEQLKKAFKDVNSTFEDVYGDLKPLTARMGEAEDRLYELALAGKQNTKEYQELLKATANYRQVQIQTDLVVDTAARTLAEKLVLSLEGAASGFALAQGAMGLFGDESEEVQRAMLKVQSAMALAQGIQGVRTAIPLFKNLGTTAKTALSGIQKGIAATGIGVLVVALGTVVAYWDEIKTAVNGVSDAQKKLINDANANLEIQKEKLSAIQSQDNILKLQGKSERQILSIKRSQIDATLKAAEADLKVQKSADKAALQSIERNNKLLKNIARVGLEISSAMLRTLAVPIDAVLKTVNKASKFIGFGELTTFNVNKAITDLNKYGAETIANFVFDIDEAKKESVEREKELNKSILDLRNERAGLDLALKQKNVKETKESYKEIISETKDYYKELSDLQDEQYRLLQEATLNDQELEIARLVEQYDKKFEIANGNAELEIALQEKLKKEIAEINEKYAVKDVELTQKTEDKKDEIVKATEEQKLQIASDTFTAIGNLAEAFAGQNRKQQEQAFKVQKAANIASATIDTYKGAQSAFASTPGGVIIKSIAAGLAITAGLANVKKIASQQFNASSSSGGGANVETPNFSAPTAQPSQVNFNTVQASGVSQLANLQPVKAYVVSGDVTTQQALDRNRIQNATF